MSIYLHAGPIIHFKQTVMPVIVLIGDGPRMGPICGVIIQQRLNRLIKKMQTVQRFHSMTYDAAPCSYPPFLVDDDPFVLGADQTGERRSCKYNNNSLTRSYRYQSYNLYWLIFKVRVQIQTGVSATVDDWLTGGSAHSFAEWPIPDRRSSFNPWLRLVECEPAVWKVLRSDPLNCCDLRSVAIVYRFVNFYS